MPRAWSESGTGYLRSGWPSGGGVAAPGGGAVGGGGANPLASLSSALDPNLLREAMLMGLEQRRLGFAEWQQNQRQQRDLASNEDRRRATSAAIEADAYKTGKGERRAEASEERKARKGARDRAAARDVAETRAVTRPAPKKFISGPGILPGYVVDPNAMSGAARQAYLPQNAGLQGSVSRFDLDGIGSDAAWAAMIADDRQRAREAYGTARG